MANTTLSPIFYGSQLTPVRLCKSSNLSGTYSNGLSGIGATLTIAASSLTIDSVVCEVGDRVLLQGQTSGYQNGIYDVYSIGSTVVLRRSADFQCVEQMVLGQWIPIIAGTAFTGRPFIVTSIPGAIGVDSVSFSSPVVAFGGSRASADGQFAFFVDDAGTLQALDVFPSDASKTSVVMASAAVLANHIACFSDTAGTVNDDASTAINGGNIQAGLSGTAGYVASFPGTALNGELRLTAVNNSGGDFDTIISNAASVGQSQTISIPDSGAASANFILSASSAAAQSIGSGISITGNNNFQTSGGGNIIAGADGADGILVSYPAGASSGYLALAGVNSAGAFNVTISNASHAQSTTVSIPDSGAASADFVLSAKAAGQSIASSTASATPGTIRALKGLMTGSNATMTSGNLVGVRGEVDCVSASGGFLYGAQGKIIPTGTLSGSVWAAAVFGQFDISAATVNAGQLASIWGDWGATGANATDLSGCRGFAFTNTTSNVLNAQIYLFGGATNLLELSLNEGGVGATYVATPAGSTAGGDFRTLKVKIDGATYYILAAGSYS